MRYFTLLFFCYFTLYLQAQEQQLAYQYYRNGDYEKAASYYKTLHLQNPYNASYLNYLIDCYQQLQHFNEAYNIINKQLSSYNNQQYLLIDLGYNFQLQHQNEQAKSYYLQALNAITKNPNLGFIIGKNFQDKHLLDYALLAYKKTMELIPNANYNFQIALIYGEKAAFDHMFNTYLDMIVLNETYIATAKSYMGRFLTDDPENENNKILKKLIIKRLQNNPETIWNQLLSWLYMLEKEFDKALAQEKAIFKRNASAIENSLEIGKLAFENKAYEAAKNCFSFVLEHANTLETELMAKLYLLEININTEASTAVIENQFQQLFTTYGKNINTLNIQTTYATFLAFQKNDPEKGIETLNNCLKLPINEFQEGVIKTKLADILVFTNKFNSALIYYTQVQNQLKNHVIGQTARFKIAQTSYFKGDFEWAQSQLKVLKNATSQLISNDALDLNLLITDNAVKDSLKLALKTYAKADLLAFQNKNKQAIDTLQIVITNYKGHPIEDEALFKQATLFEKMGAFENAIQNYLKIIAINKTDILADDAVYYLAELYLNKLQNSEKAKVYYQKIIFEYPSSIFLVDARKKFRDLRGDPLN